MDGSSGKEPKKRKLNADFIKHISLMEQGIAGFTDTLAQLVASYRNALVKQGMPLMEYLHLVWQFQQDVMMEATSQDDIREFNELTDGGIADGGEED
jgi:hypothetical protein